MNSDNVNPLSDIWGQMDMIGGISLSTAVFNGVNRRTRKDVQRELIQFGLTFDFRGLPVEPCPIPSWLTPVFSQASEVAYHVSTSKKRRVKT